MSKVDYEFITSERLQVVLDFTAGHDSFNSMDSDMLLQLLSE